jgi:hypothetical protein
MRRRRQRDAIADALMILRRAFMCRPPKLAPLSGELKRGRQRNG